MRGLFDKLGDGAGLIFKRATVRIVSCGLSVVLLAGYSSAASAAPLTFEPPAVAVPLEADAPGLDPESNAVPEEDRGDTLSDGWEESTDVATMAIGDEDGFTIYAARAANAYAWSSVATLAVDGIETDRWIGNTCLTEDGSQMGVVFGPRSMTNDERQFDAGAWGAIIDMESGEISTVGRGFSLAYFNPGCGHGNDIIMSAFTEDAHTRLVRFTPGQLDSPSVTEIPSEVYSATPNNNETVAATAGSLISVSREGKTDILAAANGVPYDLTVASDGDIAFLDRKDDTATARVYTASDADPQVSEIATAPTGRLGIIHDAKGTVYVATQEDQGDRVLPEGIELLDAPPTARVSSQGELILTQVTNALPMVNEDESVTVDPIDLRPIVTVDGTVTGTDESVVFSIDPSAGTVTELPTEPQSQQRSATEVSGDPHNAVEAESTCAVPRNDPANQAMQPKPRQVEWAVNQAVTGTLNVSRSSQYLSKAGLSSTTPQGLFPRVALSGGGRVPSQVMLGIIAQESNLWQASRYATPGVTGNPLIGNFYGMSQSASDYAWAANFADADCGYGVSQVTDGMRKAGSEGPGQVAAMTPIKQRAVALDYATNIAAGLQILSDKWNQTRNAGLTIGDGDPAYLENWFFAVWAYNSGFYPESSAAQNGDAWGVGWANNPANPKYKQNRSPFLEGSVSDAAKPQEWPYPEKVMGFAAHSYSLYEDATTVVSAFRPAWWSAESDRTAVKPPLNTFCVVSINDCDPTQSVQPNAPDTATEKPGPCLHKNAAGQYDLKCWYNGNAEWKDCSFQCGNELLRFYAGYAEQPDGVAFPPICSTSINSDPQSRGLPSSALIVDDVTAPSLRAGCTTKPTQGSFEFTFGAGNGGYPSKIDTHQLGAGFNSHFSFAHTRPEDGPLNPSGMLDVSGKWTLGTSLNGSWTRVYVHLPDHGAWTQQATYNIDLGDGTIKSRTIQQRTDANSWISLGVFEMKGVPSVTLTNQTRDGDGNDDIAWDAVAFNPLPNKPAAFVVALGDSFSSGEGASESDGSDFYPESDNNGRRQTAAPDPNAYTPDVAYNRDRNACHRSTAAWSRVASLPGGTETIGHRSDRHDPWLDYHLVACSGALVEHVLPGNLGKYREVSQLDSGFVDENTTLVTISIGGNDVRFSDIIAACVGFANCKDTTLENDTKPLPAATADRITSVGPSVQGVLTQIHEKAPNAEILLMGYPRLFESSGSCVTVHSGQAAWLAEASDQLNSTLAAEATEFNTNSGSDLVMFADPTPIFAGQSICMVAPAINGFVLPLTPGDDPLVRLFGTANGVVSAQSIHPNKVGTSLYAELMKSSLQ